ncbi:hypothetical protein TNCV_3417051 [Trichonephila clavipes]|nr:hypothetical protein TNCV_3417051 [Trichonephila clavipes]
MAASSSSFIPTPLANADNLGEGNSMVLPLQATQGLLAMDHGQVTKRTPCDTPCPGVSSLHPRDLDLQG